MSFDETILLKIKRDFTNDEAIAVLVKELSAANFIIGELKSEVEELKYDLSHPGERKTAKEWKKEEYFKQQNELLNRTQLGRRDARKDAEKWMNKYFSLMSKVSKEAPHLLNSDKDDEHRSG